MTQILICWIMTLISFTFILSTIQQKWMIYLGVTLLFSFICTLFIIPRLINFMLHKQIFGYDINKKGTKAGEKKIPQCIGFSSAISYILASFVFCVIFSKQYPYLLNLHLSCTLTIIGTILLGFADDMLDLPWRYKLVLPFFIVIPSVLAFNGSTIITLPYPFSLVIGQHINLGYLYYFYLTLLGIYCTNAINIYAGINGLEVGQSIIAATSQLILYSVKYYYHSQDYTYPIFILITFLGSALALLQHNAYPSKVFVGDTFCYFSGIVIAISAMMSNTSIIFHFLFIPQLINFLYSFPQLIGIYQCPRHRLAKYNIQKDQIQAIPTNMNLLNLSLRIWGPINQGKHCQRLLLFQIVCSAVPIMLCFFGVI